MEFNGWLDVGGEKEGGVKNETHSLFCATEWMMT